MNTKILNKIISIIHNAVMLPCPFSLFCLEIFSTCYYISINTINSAVASNIIN